MRRARLVIWATFLLAGCDGCGSVSEPVSEGAEGRRGEPSAGAVIEGVVRLADGARLPQWPENPMVAPPGRPDPPDECPPAQQRDRQPVQESDGRLDNILVALHEFATVPEHEAVTHELTISECRLTPPLIVATRGDRLRIINETDYPYLPNFGSGLMQVVLHGNSREVELGEGGIRTLTCGFAAPCGRAEIVTLYHPLHTITDGQGRFRITNVPPGEEVRVSAWHPLFEEASEAVTVQVGQTRTVELVLSPATLQVPPPPTPTAEGPSEDDPDILF